MTDHSSDDLTQPLRRPAREAASVDGTEVLSLDDLLEIAADPADADGAGPDRPAPTTAARRRVARAPDPGPLSLRPQPAAAPPPAGRRATVPPFHPPAGTPARPGPHATAASWARVRRDALTVGQAAFRTTNSWLETGDNALLVAAVALAVFLLLAVGLL